MENLVDNNIEIPEEPAKTLQGDTYVNNLMADAGAPANPDAETFDVVDGRPSPISQTEKLSMQTEVVSKEATTSCASPCVSLKIKTKADFDSETRKLTTKKYPDSKSESTTTNEDFATPSTPEHT